MKTLAPTIAMLFVIAAFFGGLFFQRKQPITAQKLTLEQILSIRELHLVKHTYHDLFFLHRNNDNNKAIRAVVEVPATITAYLNLKDIQLVYAGDTLTKVILPAAVLEEPAYLVNRMNILETRGFQLHAGKDLYPAVGSYLADAIRARMDSARNLAISNRILIQAEAEGKMYIESILMTLGRSDVKVTFNDEAKDRAAIAYLEALKKNSDFHPTRSAPAAELETIALGFLPLPR